MHFCYFYSVITISDKRVIIGVASFFGVCVLLAGIVFIIVSALLYWRKHIRERQYEGKTLAVILNSIVTVFVVYT